MNDASQDKQINAKLQDLLHLITPSFRRHRLRLVAGFIALLGVDLFQLLIPQAIKRGVDGLAQGTIDQPTLLRLAVMIICFALMIATLRFCWRYLIIGFSRYLERAVRTRLFSHIVNMDALFFEKHTTGDLIARSGNDMSAVQMACGMGLVAAADALLMSTAAICFMLYIHPTLTILALLPMPFLAIGTRVLAGKLHVRFNTVQQQFSQLTEFSRSTLVSIRLIKAYTMESFQTGRFDRHGRDYVRSNLKVAMIQGLIHPIATLVGNLGMLLILFFGGRLVISDIITIGDFVAFISYLYLLVWPMMAIGWVTNLVQRGITSLRRIHAIMESRPALPQIEPGRQPHVISPQIELKDLSFTYPSARQPALDKVDISFSPGLHGITGRTGSGKSTLCKLLLRIYPVDDNQLFMGDADVNSLPVSSIREQIAYVSQEPILFSETIGDNIALGKPEADQPDIENAARLAAIHQDIVEFPEGYQTLIGERGVKLSGGQRQRLALARALLCDRPLLVIDDGLSAVDVATEHEILKNLKRHLAGKTVIIVSNRIKLLSLTDRIIVIEDGRAVFDDIHDNLLQSSPLYRTMYDKQVRRETLPEEPA